MESLPDQSPNTKPSFRKPSNDATGRKYRRHSPVGGSDSSASDDSLKIVRRHDAIPHKEDKTKMADKNRKDDSTDFDRDYHSRSRRDDDSHRHSYSSSHGYRRNEDRARDSRSFHSGRESRDSHYSSRMRKENDFDRLRETSRSTDKYSRDRSDNGEHRSKDRDRDTNVTQRHKYNDKGSISMDRDRHRDRETRDDRKERRKSPENYKKDPPYEGSKSRIRESGFVKDSDSADFKETSNSRDKNKQDDMPSKRKLDEKEYRRNKVAYDREADEDKTSPWKKNKSDHQSENAPGIAEDQPLPSVADDGKPKESSKQDKETNSRFSSGPNYPSTDQAETADDLGAAKFAAMKAAEIVNRNLMGGGLSTTEQKKKLLWGNKKNTTVEESSSQWDLSLFPDKERQEKFKKLMGVKGDLKLEPKPDDKDTTLRAKQQEELQMDLEKQYTAGLRRRDGRTVGLGL